MKRSEILTTIAVVTALTTVGCGGTALSTVPPTEHPLVQSIPEQTELTAYFPFSEDDLAAIRASLPTDQEWVLVLDDQPFSGEAIQGFAAGRAMPIALPRAGGGAPTLIRSGEALAGAKIIGFAIEATAAGSVLAALNLFVNPQITQCAFEGCYIQYVDPNTMQLAYRPLTVQEMTENGLVYATIVNLTQNGALEGLVEMDESQLGQDPEDKIENGTPAPGNQEPPLDDSVEGGIDLMAMKQELIDAGYSPDLINQTGIVVLYRCHIAQQRPGTLEQMGSLKCDADSQNAAGAAEDLLDLLGD